MKCLHCNTENSAFAPFTKPIDGGQAYAQICKHCGRILGIRPRLKMDPPAIPPMLNTKQVARLRFVKWRLQNESILQIVPSDGSGAMGTSSGDAVNEDQQPTAGAEPGFHGEMLPPDHYLPELPQSA
jgi:hypothetical protein